eukprot:scaffold2482_cov145-Skeletonema_dohrnii-CCMP3373.AAC.6
MHCEDGRRRGAARRVSHATAVGRLGLAMCCCIIAILSKKYSTYLDTSLASILHGHKPTARATFRERESKSHNSSFLAIIKSIANTFTMACSPSSVSASHSGLQLLLAATMILTPHPQSTKSTSTQSMSTPVPYAPKKDRSAKSCAAAAPYISQLTFDVGGGDKPSWLRLNHRLDPNLRAHVSSDKLRNGNKRQAEESQSLWSHYKHPLQQKSINNKKQKNEDFTLSHELDVSSSSSTQSKGITVDSDVYLSVNGDCGGTCDNDEMRGFMKDTVTLWSKGSRQKSTSESTRDHSVILPKVLSARVELSSDHQQTSDTKLRAEAYRCSCRHRNASWTMCN